MPMPSLEKPALEAVKPQSSAWREIPRVRALFTLREGGVSSGPFGGPEGFCGLNVGLYCGDAKSCVRMNRRILADLAGSAPKWLHQVHGTEIVHGDEAAPEAEADGAWTATPGVVLAVQTADCLPVLLADAEGRAVMALHAGWRGLAAGILQKGAAKLREELHDNARILAWLAPRIGPEAFEVGEDVLEAMKATLPDAQSAFTAGKAPGKWMADLALLAKQALEGAGVDPKDIEDCGLSTAADAGRFFSYRRDAGETGRHAALIWIEPEKQPEPEAKPAP